jgi:hypothetical protein
MALSLARLAAKVHVNGRALRMATLPVSRSAEIQIFDGIGGVRCVHAGTQVELLLCLLFQVQLFVDPAQLKVQ